MVKMYFWWQFLEPNLADLARKNWCFSLGFHLGLLAGSIWGIAHLAELKIARMSVFPWCPERVAYDRVVLTTGRAAGIFGGLANRPIVVRFWWFLQFWKALEKVDEECHGFRALATTLNNGNSIWKMDFDRILGEKAVKIREFRK